MTPESWLADRCGIIETSGIRKAFELGRSLKNPVNLSIGQPHFDVPEPVSAPAHDAIDAGFNGYTVTQGIPELLAAMRADLQARFPNQERDVIITSGTSGGLLLAFFATLNPGDEVITTDPYFVSYPSLVKAIGGKLVTVDTYPDFKLDLNKVADAMTSRTKAVLLSTPSNPTGAVIDADAQQLAELCRKRGVLLVSDEIYREFHYDTPQLSPASYDPNVLVIEGFGKTYGMTGWRLGWALARSD